MIVEFIGTPGAGKTTLMPAVIEYFHEHGFNAFSVVDASRPFAKRTRIGEAVSRLAPISLHGPLLWQIFYHSSTLSRLKFYKEHPKLIWQVIKSQRCRHIPADARQYVLYWFFHLVGYYEFLKTRVQPDEVLIFDEGFIHRVVQLNASDVEDPDPTQVLAYVDLLPKPDLVIFTQAPLEVCENRVYRRGLWERFREKSAAEVSRYITNSDHVVHLTVNHIKTKGWNVIEVENGGNDPSVSRSELHRMLSELPAFAGKQSGFQSII